jgi:hypothetical protein
MLEVPLDVGSGQALVIADPMIVVGTTHAPSQSASKAGSVPAVRRHPLGSLGVRRGRQHLGRWRCRATRTPRRALRKVECTSILMVGSLFPPRDLTGRLPNLHPFENAPNH